MAIEGLLSTDVSPGFLSLQGRDPTGTSPLSRAFTAGRQGVALSRDRISVLAADRLGGTAAALGRGQKNAVAAVALLQVADAALADIETKLKRLKELATEASSTLAKGETAKAPLSTTERAIKQQEFDTLRDEITVIADNTKFNDRLLLKGASPATTLTLEIEVGGDGLAEDTITITIEAATIANLSTNLATAELSTIAKGDAALVEVTAALAKVDDIQAAVRAATISLATAAGAVGARESLTVAERDDRLALRVTVDFSRLVAEESLEERGISTLVHDVELMRQLLAAGESSAVAVAVASNKPAVRSDDPSQAGFGAGFEITFGAGSSGGSTGGYKPASSPKQSEPSVDVEA